MNIDKLLICSATQKKKSEDTELWKSLQDLNLDVDLNIFTENTKPLSEIYNLALSMAKEDNADALILVHDDVWLEHDPTPKLENLFDSYDIVGVAGTSQVQIKSPALWHLMGGGFGGGSLHGAVAHAHDNRKVMTSFGPYPQRVIYIDGVFMAFNRKAIETGSLFDENSPSKYHFYDINMCDNARKEGLKIAVGDIMITHESPGLREFTEDWKAGEQYFLNKHNN